MGQLPGSCVACPTGEAVDADDEAEGSCVSGLARSLRQRLEEERRRTEEAEAELDRQRAGNAGLGASLSRLEAQLAAKKAFWEVHAAPCCRRTSPPRPWKVILAVHAPILYCLAHIPCECRYVPQRQLVCQRTIDMRLR